MLYDRELHFLCETLKKSMIPATIITSSNSEDSIINQNFKLLFINGEDVPIDLKNLEPFTIYRVNNSFDLHCIILRLPDTATGSSLIIGPYLTKHHDKQNILEIAEQNSLSPQQIKLLERFYGNSAVISETSHIFVMIDTFAEHIWGANNFKIIDIDNNRSVEPTKLDMHFSSLEQDTLINMKLMEERYAAENEMMDAVSSGQPHKGMRLIADFSNMPFEKRLDDPLRNLKNYSIIMNTLLRKSAEKGGVHPLYIDEISSSFATKIEHSPSPKHLQSLMGDMYYSYCELVQQHSFKNLSSPVKKAVLLIEKDISSNISLATIARAQNINASYLSTLFKREMGQGVIEYITEKRMSKAADLLKNTTLQVQTIAAHCGILDVQYFSKLFKKYFGVTPNNFRKSKKNV
ncbi:MAG: helix-turn-helix transcriptional regulator [Clostridia bacterium]|nr:helix-turn-helix transcriptional regulator [Clostridia bacterium]